MRRLQQSVIVLAVTLLSSCAQLTSYHVDAVNRTSEGVDHAVVVFDDERRFEWGAMDPGVDKGMWPMPGPLGRRANIEWEDAKGRKHLQPVAIPRAGTWDTVRFVLTSNGTVVVETR